MTNTTAIKTLELITEIHKHNRTFYICKDAMGFFWGIEDVFTNREDGDLTIACNINGITGFRSVEMQDTIRSVNNALEIDKLISLGMDKEEAIIRVTLPHLEDQDLQTYINCLNQVKGGNANV